MTAPQPAPKPPIAYIAGVFPTLSETFVYREVRELRRRGWTVLPISLGEPTSTSEDLAELRVRVIVVYGKALGRTLASAAIECLRHPVRAAGTLVTALLDALWPGERLDWRTRLKVPAQAMAAIGVAQRLRQAGAGHVHCHFAHAPATIGMYAARQCGIPFSFTGHANDLFQRRALLSAKLRRAAFVACISEWHRAFYEQIKSARGHARYLIIRCGVETPASASPAAAGGVFRIVSVCRLVEKKGIDTLVRALAMLKPRRQVRLSVAGDGPLADSLRALASQLGLDNDVRWLGAIEQRRVSTLLADADAFVLPCRDDSRGDRDGIPVALMEAMAAGLPVISGDLPAIHELVADGETGLLVSGDDPVALSAAIDRLAGDSVLASRLAANGRRRVEEEFSLSFNVDRLEAAFARSLGLPIPPIAPVP